MAGAEARLDDAGVALWLTDWKVDAPGAWTPRRVLTLVGGQPAGRIDFLVHPDRRALSVWGLEVEPEFRGRYLASVMMDALYAAHPSAWIDHGGRSLEGVMWWDRYSDPAPERNIHNRPPAEWAQYFDPLQVAAQRTRNAYQNTLYGLDGHSAAEYRYGERLEEEFLAWLPAFKEAGVQGPDPAVQELHGGVRLVLPPRLHGLVHDIRSDSGERAEILLGHIGHGSLPCAAGWNTTQRAAFEDTAHEQAFDNGRVEHVTHVAFRVRLAPGQETPPHKQRATWLTYMGSPGIDVKLTGMAWRSPHTPWVTHEAAFSSPIDAAIEPERWYGASAQYTARFDAGGGLLPGQSARRVEPEYPFAGREAEIAAVAARLMGASHRRAVAPLPPPARPGVPQQQGHPQNVPPSQQSPRLR
ncbi:hypothetical protein [Streptomyces solaniscabiei]|uniref:hypothetical protein n=1 Tax=Streptomyces solaniscabiei TaxID=2683255 RepID=UPI001CE308B1|nr:hypothetical protein [Streptomyces solaniscabiei]